MIMISSQLFKRAAKETEEDEKQELLESEGRKSTSLELQTLGTSVDVVAPVPSSCDHPRPSSPSVKSNDETHGTVAESAILSDSPRAKPFLAKAKSKKNRVPPTLPTQPTRIRGLDARCQSRRNGAGDRDGDGQPSCSTGRLHVYVYVPVQLRCVSRAR